LEESEAAPRPRFFCCGSIQQLLIHTGLQPGAHLKKNWGTVLTVYRVSAGSKNCVNRMETVETVSGVVLTLFTGLKPGVNERAGRRHPRNFGF